MATLEVDGHAPYAPAHAVIALIERHRKARIQQLGADLLARLDVKDSLIPRTIQSAKLLGLVDDDGSPTDEFEDLRKASMDEFKPRLAAMLRTTYAPVFEGVDDLGNLDRVRDQFRWFNPSSMQERMATLFLGLCEYAEIIDAAPARKPGPKTGRSTTPKPKQKPTTPPETRTETQQKTPAVQGTDSGSSYKISLRSGGMVTVTCSANLWDLSPEDREFLFGLIDKVKGYEAQRSLQPAPAAALDDVGETP